MDAKEYNRQYYLNNKEKIKQQQIGYRLNNKEKIKEKKKSTQKAYRLNNKEKIKAYYQTPEGKKSVKISSWRSLGLIETEDYTYDSLYEAYLVHTNCDECNVVLTIDRYNTATTKCMDHDHVTRIFRNFVCQSCNTKRG